MDSREALVKHYVAYSAKFLGFTAVDQQKGTDVVRAAVRKLKFQRHIKKSEGEKIPKVELQISIYGVKILDPKTKDVQHNCQLHRMSFCADDKTDKRIFAYICTEPETKRHLCYVFDSEKCAEEITVAIGQAFELAYKMFLQSGGKDVESRKQIGNLQKRIQDLEMENTKLKKQLQRLEDQLISAQSSPPADSSMLSSSSMSCCTDEVSSLASLEFSSITITPLSSPDSGQSAVLLTPPPTKPAHFLPSRSFTVPRPAGSIPAKAASTDAFDMLPFTPGISSWRTQMCNGSRNDLSPPCGDGGTDLFGAAPFDPFTCGLSDFPPDVQSRLEEMQEGFKMGLTLEGAVFLLDQVDSRC